MFAGKKLEISPVRDAYREGSECPLCLLMNKADTGLVDSLLGGAVMIPETRLQINRTGFCPDHYRKLAQGGNRLGLSLMTATHIREKLPELRRLCGELSAGEVGRGKRKEPLSKAVERFRGYLRDFSESCLICERLAATLERYLFTIVYLWQKDEEFAAGVRASRGFCMPHLSAVLGMAANMLAEKELSGFLSDILPLVASSLERLTGELDVFAEHFDYRKTGMAWGPEKDAPARAIQKLSGRITTP